MELPRLGDLFLGKYQLEAELGAGGFATVFLAVEVALGRRVAVKVIRPGPTGYADQIASRFSRETKVLASLSDPHTVTMLDWGRAPDGLLYMIFEYVPGEDLAQLLQRAGRLEEPVVVHILRQLLQSLGEAHRAGVLHRDLKPENIRIYEYDGDPWRAKLLDFGIAKPVGGSAQITTKGALIGSPRYMSPEQLYDHDLTPASDLYSLGLVTFEMLLGREALAPNSLAAQVLRLGDPGSLDIPDTTASPALRAVLERMLRRTPAERFQSADQVLAALSPPQRTSAPRPAPAPAPAVAPGNAAPRADLRRLAALAGVLLLLIALALTVYAALDAQSAPPSAAPPPAAHRAHNPLAAAPAAADAAASNPLPDAGPAAEDAGHRASPGCGKPAPPHDSGQSAVAGINTVRWHLYVPPSYDPNRPHPVLFFFHEDVEKARDGLKLTNLRAGAAQRGMIIIALQDPDQWSWQGIDAVRPARTALETTAEQLCIDRTRMFAFGHGNGGRAVERLPCVIDGLVATASTAHRMTTTDEFCTSAPIPHLHVAPLADGFDPVEGGQTCGNPKISLAAMEALWRERNGCTEPRRRARVPDRDECRTWTCEQAEFVSCHVQGGHRWPGQTHRAGDLLSCDGPPMRFPLPDAVWQFFDAVSGPPADQR